MTNENLDETNPADRPLDGPTADAGAHTADGGSATAAGSGVADAGATDSGAAAQAPPQYGVGPFSIREVVLAGVLIAAFVLSFVPLNAVADRVGVLIGGANVWVSGLGWILAIGLPVAAVFLIVLRRLSPQGIRRFGSLGIDQFASVAFSVAALVWLQWVWETVAIALEVGVWTRTWVVWVMLALMLAGVVLTVFAPLIPGLEQDFQDRPEVPAHRNARPVRPVVPRPKTERPRPHAPAGAAHAPAGAAYAPQGGAPYTPQAGAPYAPETYDTGVVGGAGTAHPGDTTQTASYGTDVFAPLTAQHDAAEPAAEEQPASDETAQLAQAAQPEGAYAPVQQAFWALVPEERDVVDEYGRPLFRIGPTAWALVIEDRGPTFVVRHEDGRVGYLHDVTGVTRG